MPPALAFLARRLLQIVPVVLAIAALNFALLHLAPGDAADIVAAGSGGGSAEFTAELRRSFGLDRPLWEQFFIYIARLLSLDLGWSHVQQAPVLELVAGRVGPTLLLMLAALAIA
ncbi:MAG: ABC transporter permease, partial [Alphaproteobacteria bacterium]|nr:ABC transporter permease [Alphaproteobacteria bacterium]